MTQIPASLPKIDRATQILAICQRIGSAVECGRLAAMCGEAILLHPGYRDWPLLKNEAMKVAAICKSSSLTGAQLEAKVKEVLGVKTA